VPDALEPPKPSSKSPAKALDGITVVDLTRLLPGPYCTMLLADLGADVIKIEDPRGGDPARVMPPLEDGVGVYFKLLNRNKRSVALDLRDAQARDALHAVLARADVCVEGFRPDTARQIGVDGASLAARYPRLVHCSITGYGQAGPYAARGGHDLNYQALAGLLGVAARPAVPRLLVADITGGMHAALAILAALVGRHRTGRGAALDVALHDAAMAWLPFATPGAIADAPEGELGILGDYACYNVYRAADGKWLALGALEAKFWERFCRALGCDEWVPLQWAPSPARERLLDDVQGVLRDRSRDDWLTHFAAVDCCLTPIHSPADAVSDPHTVTRRLDDAVRGKTGRPAPLLGADTVDVLRAANVAPEGIESLLRKDKSTQR
jgi:crotonobetainyl-CoA:carnitine CoA-transferase CaiB-like acyl-CoA transferase